VDLVISLEVLLRQNRSQYETDVHHVLEGFDHVGETGRIAALRELWKRWDITDIRDLDVVAKAAAAELLGVVAGNWIRALVLARLVNSDDAFLSVAALHCAHELNGATHEMTDSPYDHFADTTTKVHLLEVVSDSVGFDVITDCAIAGDWVLVVGAERRAAFLSRLVVALAQLHSKANPSFRIIIGIPFDPTVPPLQIFQSVTLVLEPPLAAFAAYETNTGMLRVTATAARVGCRVRCQGQFLDVAPPVPATLYSDVEGMVSFVEARALPRPSQLRLLAALLSGDVRDAYQHDVKSFFTCITHPAIDDIQAADATEQGSWMVQSLGVVQQNARVVDDVVRRLTRTHHLLTINRVTFTPDDPLSSAMKSEYDAWVSGARAIRKDIMLICTNDSKTLSDDERRNVLLHFVVAKTVPPEWSTLLGARYSYLGLSRWIRYVADGCSYWNHHQHGNTCLEVPISVLSKPSAVLCEIKLRSKSLEEGGLSSLVWVLCADGEEPEVILDHVLLPWSSASLKPQRRMPLRLSKLEAVDTKRFRESVVYDGPLRLTVVMTVWLPLEQVLAAQPLVCVVEP